jgi:hypothetical protein
MMNKVDLEKLQTIAFTAVMFSMAVFVLVGAVAVGMLAFRAL